MPAKKNIGRETYITAIRKHHGNLHAIARALGVERESVRYMIRQYPEINAVYNEAVEIISDIAERHLVDGVVSGNPADIRYWLDNKARNRGYGRQLLEHTGELTIRVEYGDDNGNDPITETP